MALCSARCGFGTSRPAIAPRFCSGRWQSSRPLKSAGVGSALMRRAIEEARRRGHRAILLVGDAPYYARFGFTAEKTGQLAMPGPLRDVTGFSGWNWSRVRFTGQKAFCVRRAPRRMAGSPLQPEKESGHGMRGRFRRRGMARFR
jgi:hypothetical protein